MLARVQAAVRGALAIADRPGDDDDLRLRKRAGVAAGFITVVAPLSLPLEAPGAIGLALGVGLSLYNVLNLVILARTKRFERFVVALIAAGPVFVFCTNAIAGGVTTSGAAWVWAFLTPGYAILALGPRRATPWFIVFVAVMLAAVALDPVIRTWFGPPPYVVQLVYYAQNVGVPLTVTFLLLRYTDMRRRAAEARSDELLTNAIPRSIADRLRHGEDRIADSYGATSVVFLDVAGFTAWSAGTPPDRVVALLDDLFTRLDALAAELGLEKVKTIGDAYMAVAGAPVPRADHAQAATQFGLEALVAVARWRDANGLSLGARVGIASGPAVGGVIGRRRILFDLWGSTVNAASRLESNGVPGRVQVDAATRDLLGDAWAFEERTIDAKGLGRTPAYLVVEAPTVISRNRASPRS